MWFSDINSLKTQKKVLQKDIQLLEKNRNELIKEVNEVVEEYNFLVASPKRLTESELEELGKSYRKNRRAIDLLRKHLEYGINFHINNYLRSSEEKSRYYALCMKELYNFIKNNLE